MVFYIFSLIALIIGIWAIYISYLEESLIGFKTNQSLFIRLAGILIIAISIISVFQIHKI